MGVNMSVELNCNIDIGTMLLEKKIITPVQLRQALGEQRLKGSYLSQRLIELGHIRDSDLASCLTCQYGFSYIPINSYQIERNALETIPAPFASCYCVIPVEMSDRLLTVVMADPLNNGVIEILRQITHCEILVFVSTYREIKVAIEKYYGVPFKNFDLDKYKNDVILRDNLGNDRIDNEFYTGSNRRRYRRLQVDLPGEYYHYPDIIYTKILNVSMGGVLFETRTLLPPGTQIPINLHLDKGKFITAVVEVVRCTSNNMAYSPYQTNGPLYHETGAFINFLSEENQDMLAEFLREKMSV
jgi:hypothetical protein